MINKTHFKNILISPRRISKKDYLFELKLLKDSTGNEIYL
jgi:hypothetical protein